MHGTSRILRLVFLGFVLLYIAFAVLTIAVDTPNYLWDFKMYLMTEEAYDSGLNPYDRASVETVAERGLTPFFYFPTALWILKPFTFVPQQTAMYLFIILKCCLLVYLVWLWEAVFLEQPHDPLFWLFCILAYNATIFVDLRAGNISLLEVTLIWSAFWCFLKGRHVEFSILLCLAAAFRLSPLFFGLLLLVPNQGPRVRPVITFLIAVACLFGFTWLLDPSLFVQFFPNALGITRDEPLLFHIMNPASLPLIRTFCVLLGDLSGVELPGPVPFVMYLAWVCTVLAVTWRILGRLDLGEPADRKLAIGILCLAYAVVLPRFKDYSYILLILPTYYIILKARYTSSYPFLFLLCVLSSVYVTLPGMKTFAWFVWNYYPFFVAVMIWILYVVEIRLIDSSSRSAQGL